jgi:type IV pilus assembly protein PilE
MKLYSAKGFTLIEVMIVVAIIGILAAIAYPSYQEQVRSSRRADAQGALMEASQAMERYYAENNFTYVGAVEGVTFPLQSPFSGGTPAYDITVAASDATSYTLQAAPIGPQAGDRCGNMTLDNTGARNAAEANCWR